VNVDEFEHTEVEQQARRDQQRVLTAMARRNQQHDPGADVEHFGLRTLLMEAVDFCVATSVVTDGTQAAFRSPTAHDDATAGSPPTHPAQLSDGGGSDVGGVGSHQTQDTGTETNSSTATQASTTLAGAIAPSNSAIR
jgi:hypothetical protein